MATDEERYHSACHAMQTGVAIKMARGSKDTEPKHLRVGINSAMVTDAAIAKLLIEKGIFTREEYVKAVADEMEEEVKRYEQELGPNITLG